MGNKLIAGLLILVALLLVLNYVLWREVLFPKTTPAAVPTTPTRAATRVATPTPTPAAAAEVVPPASAGPCPGGITPAANVLTSQQDLLAAAQVGRHNVAFCVAVAEQEINNGLADYLGGDPNAGFSDVAVALEPGQAVITGKAHVLGLTLDTRAVTHIVLAGGRPRLKVIGLQISGATAPGLLRDRVAQMIEAQADLPILQSIPLRVDQVEVQTGQVLASGILQ